MTKEIVVRMHQRNVAMAHRRAWRDKIDVQQQIVRARIDQAYLATMREIARTPDIRSVHPVTPQQSRLERAAAYFRAVFR